MSHDPQFPQHGGCLCGALRYRVTASPVLTSICHCHFCQKVTGSFGAVEPIFDGGAFALTRGAPGVYDHVSEGSGKVIHLHFCQNCGTKTHLTFERWPERLAVYGGSFDDPVWFAITPETAKLNHIDAARGGRLVPDGFPT